MTAVVCKCGARRTVAGAVAGRPLLSAMFALFDAVDLRGAGWTVGDDGRWRCRHCTVRSRMMRLVYKKTPENKPNPENV